jgi:hypothetical protein
LQKFAESYHKLKLYGDNACAVENSCTPEYEVVFYSFLFMALDVLVWFLIFTIISYTHTVKEGYSGQFY